MKLSDDLRSHSILRINPLRSRRGWSLCVMESYMCCPYICGLLLKTMQNGWMLKVNEFVTNVNSNTGEHKMTTKSIGQKKAPIPYLLYLFCPISFRFLCTWNGPYLPYSQRWVWLGHCSLSHTPGISPRFYLGPPWSHSHGNCKGWWRAGREFQKLISCFW